MEMLENVKLGFIGGGAMAEAITAGLVGKNVIPGKNIFISDHKADRCKELAQKYGVQAKVGADFLSQVDFLILAVKPQVASKALEEIKGDMTKESVLVSIVAGLTLASLQETLGELPMVRVMPNTPLAVGAGMTAFAVNDLVDASACAAVQEIFSSGGEAIQVKEAQLDAVTGLSGSGPAYGFLVIDALADRGVAAGFRRADAIKLAAQTMLGAAQMVLKTGSHPDVLRDQVTSPAGTTIEGVRVLEKNGLRSSLIEAVVAAAEKSKALGKK
jgi:pyrroline-5-carboxylate reductase